jgi:uncharacterized protein YcaQ
MMTEELNSDAGVGPLDGRVRALAEAFREDYDGRELDALSVIRAVAFAATVRAPDTVSAGEEGGVYLGWKSAKESLAVHFLVSGATVWAGVRNGKRPYGSGEPLAQGWCCLRSNV